VNLPVPLITWPVFGVSIVLLVTSVILSLFVLLHKGRGGGMSDLFGGGVSSSMGGTSVAERNLDRITIIIAIIWLASVITLLIFYRYGI
jgi:preprotein translocase, secG subunit